MRVWKGDLCEELGVTVDATDFASLSGRDTALRELPPAVPGAATARFNGFDLDDRPTVSGLADLDGEILTAQTTVALQRAQIGATVVLLFERGDLRRPIIVGVLQERSLEPTEDVAAPPVSAQADDNRIVIVAEREIVLRCGDASITLTRAGKVMIKGTYVLSRSSGHNKIKGAAVDIN